MDFDKDSEINDLMDRASMLAILDIYDRLDHINNILENIEKSIDKLEYNYYYNNKSTDCTK